MTGDSIEDPIDMAQSPATGSCKDTDCERFNMKFFFLETHKRTNISLDRIKAHKDFQCFLFFV